VTPEASSDDWQIWRQDEAGNRYLVQSAGSEAEARRLCGEYERRGHKQLYWVQRAAKTGGVPQTNVLPPAGGQRLAGTGSSRGEGAQP
jgi:hypothetical protein